MVSVKVNKSYPFIVKTLFDASGELYTTINIKQHPNYTIIVIIMYIDLSLSYMVCFLAKGFLSPASTLQKIMLFNKLSAIVKYLLLLLLLCIYYNYNYYV